MITVGPLAVGIGRGQSTEVEHLLSIDVAPRRGGIIAISPSGTEIYKVNALQVGGYHLSVWDAQTGALLRELVPKTEIVMLRDIDLSPDGTEIYATGMTMNNVHVFSSRNGQLLREW